MEHPCGSCNNKTCNFNEPGDTCDVFVEYLRKLEEQCNNCKEKYWDQCRQQCNYIKR